MDEKTVNVILAMHGGLPYEGPFVTEDKDQARQAYEDYCKSLDLPTDDPHDGESDVFWWTVKVGGGAQEVTPW